MELIGRHLGSTSTGRAGRRVHVDEPQPVRVGYHQMGTTRMSASDRHGVVDGQCRVHGFDNLYIAGSSVFPTSGFANPTFTIVALALRLAGHLQRKLGA